MCSKIDFETYCKNRKPIFAYNPQGVSNISLLKSVIDAGGVGLIDLERLSLEESLEQLKSCYQQLAPSWGVRVTTKKQFEQVLALHSDTFPLIVIIGDFDLTEKELTKAQAKQLVLLAEVVSLNEAYNKKWAEAYVVKGNEAAGRVGDETSFILTQQ
ncbi:MAG: hypothetical protein DRP02_11750, partial [Candidatus Gerdarchaeota archaeon]